MSTIDHYSISKVLGSTVQPYSRTRFGGFTAARAVGEMLALRPTRPAPLPRVYERDLAIAESFAKVYQGYGTDRVLADPALADQLIEQMRAAGLAEPAPLLLRRLLRIRKDSTNPVTLPKATQEDVRDLEPYLLPAEIAFAQLTYQADVSVDDLLANAETGRKFDAMALKVGGGRGTPVDYRLAALHLRKNVRSRTKDEKNELKGIGASDVAERWKAVGPLASIRLGDVPKDDGIYAVSEPNRFLYLTRSAHVRDDIDRFRDEKLLDALGNTFWQPHPESVSVQIIDPRRAGSLGLRILELKALEVYDPVFNLPLTARKRVA